MTGCHGAASRVIWVSLTQAHGDVAMSIPKLSFHRASSRFYVWQDGKRVYLGRGTNPDKPPMEVMAQYREAVRRILGDEPAKPEMVPDSMTVVELAAQYLNHVKKVYGDGEVRCLEPPIKHFVSACGMVEAIKFGPRKLAEFQQYLVGLGRTRQGINKTIKTIRRVFKWAVSMELVPTSVHQALGCLEPLKFDRTAAPEAPELPAVSDEQITAVLPHLGPRIASMVMLQRLTGMRPGEVCAISMEEIDRTVPGRWVYRPVRHKTAYRGKKRQVPIVGRALEILLPWVRADGKPLFSPAEEVADWISVKRANRKTKVQPSQMDRSKEDPERTPGDRYDSKSYGLAIKRACQKAGIQKWTPNGLRKARAQEIADQFGIEHARALLGHTSAEVTARYYAKNDLAKAVEALEAMG